MTVNRGFCYTLRMKRLPVSIAAVATLSMMVVAQGSDASNVCKDAKCTPVMASLVTPLQVPSKDYDVVGFRLSLIYGDCREFTGLDLGVAQRAAGDFTGLAVGGLNLSGGMLAGGQVGLVNWNGNEVTQWDRRSKGAQIGIFNYSGTFCGLQDGIVNVSDGAFVGLQASFLNFAEDVEGLQCGGYLVFGVNVASGSVRGCQIGLVNYARRVRSGCQIGIVNIISENGWAPVLPIINGGF